EIGIVRGAAGTTAPGASIAATIVTTAKLPWHSDSWRAALTRGNHPGVDGTGAGSLPSSTGADERHQLVMLPRTRAIRRHGADLLHRRHVHRSPVLPPFAPDVGQDAGNLLVGECGSDRRHQADRTFLAVHQNPRRDVGRRQREQRSDEGRRDLVLSSSVGLMARLANVSINLLTGVKALLLLRRQRCNRRGGAGFARPLDAREHSRRAWPKIGRRRGESGKRLRFFAQPGWTS